MQGLWPALGCLPFVSKAPPCLLAKETEEILAENVIPCWPAEMTTSWRGEGGRRRKEKRKVLFQASDDVEWLPRGLPRADSRGWDRALQVHSGQKTIGACCKQPHARDRPPGSGGDSPCGSVGAGRAGERSLGLGSCSCAAFPGPGSDHSQPWGPCDFMAKGQEHWTRSPEPWGGLYCGPPSSFWL